MSFPQSTKITKGYLIEFSRRLFGSVPNIIPFQFNPENLTRTLEAWYTGEGENSGGQESATAQPHDPPETFDLTLAFDALDESDNPLRNSAQAVTGVAERLAALEILLYPEPDEPLLGSPSASLAGSATPTGVTLEVPGAGNENMGDQGKGNGVPRGQVPELLFVWGPGKTLPVRITSFSVEEQKFSPLLYPIRATVTIGLKILTPNNLPCQESSQGKLGVAYDFYVKQKRILAAANNITTLTP